MRRRPTEEEIDRVVRLLADFGWPASRGWVRSLVEVEASGNVGNLVAAVRELGEDRDFFLQCRLDRKDARYVWGALRRVLDEVEDQERFRASYPTPSVLEETPDDADATAN